MCESLRDLRARRTVPEVCLLVWPKPQCVGMVSKREIRGSKTTSVRGVPFDIPHVVIERQFQDGVRSESYQIDMAGGITGGVTAGASVPSWSIRYAVRWDGDQLVIETGRYSGPTPESGHTQSISKFCRLMLRADLSCQLPTETPDRPHGRQN